MKRHCGCWCVWYRGRRTYVCIRCSRDKGCEGLYPVVVGDKTAHRENP